VDVYVGGDHAVRHLIYARFWHKFLYDIGSVSTIEPFARLEFLGFILAEDGRKMSKRYGNVINPDDVVAEHGADAFRIYEMFMGPFENTIRWSTENLAGSRRFIERVWKLQNAVVDAPVEALEAELHKTVAKVGEDIGAFKFNTAVSQMMIFLNAAEKAKAIGREQWGIFLRLLAPFAPHIAEELWHAAGREGSVHTAAWPEADPSKLAATTATIAVQVNGKVRGTITVNLNASESEVLAAARIQAGKWLEGKTEQKALYIPGKIVTLVAA
jgi:leucyl-tRNA synthetase